MSLPSAIKKEAAHIESHHFQYAFISHNDDEIQFTKMLTAYYQKEYGYIVHDRKDIYGGYNSTLICKINNEIIGGLSAYINDSGIGSPLPMERQGICLDRYMDISNIRYAEICRAFVLPEFRKFHIYSALLEKMITFLTRIRCKKSVWIAKKFNSKFYELELIRLGRQSKNLGVVTLNRHSKDGSLDMEYYLSCCDLF